MVVVAIVDLVAVSIPSENSMSDKFFEIQSLLNEANKEFEETKAAKRQWNTAWYEARNLAGKMYWDGVQVGYAWGLQGQEAGYGTNERVSETARDISILIAIARGSSDITMQELLDRLEPLTFYVVKYNTGDQILFQAINGKPTAMRIKTHDGLFVDEAGNLSKAPQAQLFDKDSTR